tara:strand:- start:86 stop:604 length:519 start_codon:yes stop_codon:yes gene_type:complete
VRSLNTTVTSTALAVNKVLTASYHACYSDAIEGDELVLLTAPLAATSEVQALYESGLIDIESALPAALHSLGSSAVEIEGALKRRRDADQSGTDSKIMEAQTSAQLGDADVALKQAQTLKTNEEIDGVRANTEKTRAEVTKVHADAKNNANAPQSAAPTPADEPKPANPAKK